MADKILHTMLGGMRPQVQHRGEIIVIGLGRFGSSLASTLIEMGHEVLGIDFDEGRVQQHAELLTHVVQADTTSEKTLRQLGVGDAVTAVVAIGADIEASVLTTGALVDIGVPNIWAKALTLERVEGKPGVVKLTLSYQNKMPTRIVGMAVLVDIANPLGKIVFTQTLDDETVILPGEKKKADSYWSFPDNAAVEGEPYDRLWQITKNGTATVTTKVKKVVLDDGTVIHAKRRSLFKNN